MMMRWDWDGMGRERQKERGGRSGAPRRAARTASTPLLCSEDAARCVLSFACMKRMGRRARGMLFFCFEGFQQTQRPVLSLSLSSHPFPSHPQAAALADAFMDRWALASADARAAAARFRSGRDEAATFPAAAAARRAPFLEMEDAFDAFGLSTFLGREAVSLMPSGTSEMSTVAGLTRPAKRGDGWMDGRDDERGWSSAPAICLSSPPLDAPLPRSLHCTPSHHHT